MYHYKRIIETPNAIEIEYYQSIRPVGKKFVGRGINKNLTSEKQAKANKIRTIKKWVRIINCNFTHKDWWCRFSAPFGTYTNEKDFKKAVSNFFKRIQRACKKLNIEFKYIGFIECGKLGKNWHLHIILSDEVRQIAYNCWYYKDGGTNFENLWHNGNVKELAKYIRKDVTGSKRLMNSRNLKRPKVKVKPTSKRELLKLEREQVPPAPKGYYYVEDEFEKYISDVTGARFYFKFQKVTKE